MLAAELEDGEIADAVIAKSKGECDRIWALRDDVIQVGRNAPIFTFDVSLAIAEMESYVAEVREGLTARWPAMTLMVFGHLGDGNLHLIPGVGDGSREARQDVEEIVYGALRKRGGSVSRRAWHRSARSATISPVPAVADEIALMRTLKKAFDPRKASSIPERFSRLTETQLSGYSAIGDLTNSVQEPPGFLRKKFQKKFRHADLSTSLTQFVTQNSAPVAEKIFCAVR